MKRYLCLLIAIIIMLYSIPAFAGTENFDFTGLSFDELIKVQEKLNTAIWASDGWKEVTVPIGIHLVGRDVPEGRWCITPSDPNVSAYIEYGSELDESGNSIKSSDTYCGLGKAPFQSYMIWNLVEGNYIEIKFSSVILSPAAIGLEYNSGNENITVTPTPKPTATPKPAVDIEKIVDEILSYKNDKTAKAWEQITKYHSYMTKSQLQQCLISYARWKGFEKAEESIKDHLKSPRSYYFYDGRVGEPELQDDGTYRTYYSVTYGATNSFGGEVTDTTYVYVYFTIDIEKVEISFTKVTPLIF